MNQEKDRNYGVKEKLHVYAWNVRDLGSAILVLSNIEKGLCQVVSFPDLLRLRHKSPL